ncbi:protein phosphatase 2C domain-containing protein [Brachyspira pulli]|uniref:protein phosphatase 2C domain-containing protein n=1 Tax=Brachyspira pulli TaxID=310721 RepID=UPI00300712EA
MNKNTYTCNKYLAQGKSHIKNNTPCQDYCDYYIDEDSSMIVLSDGAGSCKHSHIGSKLLVEKTLSFFKERKKVLLDKKEEDIKTALMNYLFKELENKAKEENIEEKELSATLLFVFCYEDKFIYGHIGDGLICCDYDGRLRLISEGTGGGEYKNETVFFRTNIDPKYLKIEIKPLKNIFSFYCSSDGLEHVLITKKDKKLADVLQTFSQWMYKYEHNPEFVTKNLKLNLDEIAANNHDIHDDLSLIIMNINNDEIREIRKIKERILDPVSMKHDELAQDINNKIAENTEAINKKIDKNNNEITDINNNISELKETIKSKDNEINKLNKQVESLNTGIKNQDNEIVKLNRQIESLNINIKNQKDEINKLNSKLEQQKNEILNSNKNINTSLNDLKNSMNIESKNIYNTLHSTLKQEMESIVKQYISDILSKIDSSQSNLADNLKKQNEKLLDDTKQSINEKKNHRINYTTLIPIYAVQIATLVLLILSLFK